MKITMRKKAVEVSLSDRDLKDLRDLLEIIARERTSRPVSWELRSDRTKALLEKLCGLADGATNIYGGSQYGVGDDALKLSDGYRLMRHATRKALGSVRHKGSMANRCPIEPRQLGEGETVCTRCDAIIPHGLVCGECSDVQVAS